MFGGEIAESIKVGRRGLLPQRTQISQIAQTRGTVWTAEEFSFLARGSKGDEKTRIAGAPFLRVE